jgi:hypothetical protein
MSNKYSPILWTDAWKPGERSFESSQDSVRIEETEKYGHGSRGTRNQEWLRWRRPVAIYPKSKLPDQIIHSQLGRCRRPVANYCSSQSGHRKTKSRPHFKTHIWLGKQKSMVMGPKGARNQEWLLAKAGSKLYLITSTFWREMFCRHAECGGNVHSAVEMQRNKATHTLLYRYNRSAPMCVANADLPPETNRTRYCTGARTNFSLYSVKWSARWKLFPQTFQTLVGSVFSCVKQKCERFVMRLDSEVKINWNEQQLARAAVGYV